LSIFSKGGSPSGESKPDKGDKTGELKAVFLGDLIIEICGDSGSLSSRLSLPVGGGGGVFFWFTVVVGGESIDGDAIDDVVVVLVGERGVVDVVVEKDDGSDVEVVDEDAGDWLSAIKPRPPTVGDADADVPTLPIIEDLRFILRDAPAMTPVDAIIGVIKS